MENFVKNKIDENIQMKMTVMNSNVKVYLSLLS